MAVEGGHVALDGGAGGGGCHRSMLARGYRRPMGARRPAVLAAVAAMVLGACHASAADVTARPAGPVPTTAAAPATAP